MYYPYLRGRQYELIGLRELCAKNKLQNVIPVIEPVKTSPTLLNLLKTFCDYHKEFIFITNPSVGTFQKDLEFDSEYKERFEKLITACKQYLINGYIMKSSNNKIEDSKNSVALCFNMDQVKYCNDLNLQFKSIFIPDSSTARKKIKMSKVLFEDRFEAEERNADYAEDNDQSYSNDFFYFKDDYDGFSDFSIVGNEYNESGFAPFAVAIHIVYMGKEEDELRIHHFVSDSNDDINNPQKKFYEALYKLVNFPALKNDVNKTYALQEFKRIYENETYPGLGTIKKLSIMHHIELVSKLLSSNKE